MCALERVTLDVGSVPIALAAREGVFWTRMLELCTPFAVEQKPSFTIELDLSPTEIYEEEAALLFALHRLESTRELGDGSDDSLVALFGELLRDVPNQGVAFLHTQVDDQARSEST